MLEWVWSIGGMIRTGETEVLGEKHYTVWVVDEWIIMEHWLNDTDRRNWSSVREICPCATLSTANFKWTFLAIFYGASHSNSNSWLYEWCCYLFNSVFPLRVSVWLLKWQNKSVVAIKEKLMKLFRKFFSLLRPSLFFFFWFRHTSAQMKLVNQYMAQGLQQIARFF
jgi:hypothetical protein